MKSKLNKQKLYCYVDETGQDTEGQIFVVSIVLTGKERDESNAFIKLSNAVAGLVREATEGNKKYGELVRKI